MNSPTWSAPSGRNKRRDMKDIPNPNEWFEWIDNPIKPITIESLRRKLRRISENEKASPIVGVVVFKELWPGQPISSRSYMTNSQQETEANKNKEDVLLAWRLDGGENGVNIWANISGKYCTWQNECPEGNIAYRRTSTCEATCEKWEVEYCYAPTRHHRIVQTTDPYPVKLFERNRDDDFDEEGGEHSSPPLSAYDFVGSFDPNPNRLSLEEWKKTMLMFSGNNAIMGVVVFSAEEYDEKVSLESRSFACRSDAPFFLQEGAALDGVSLDGIDRGITLETMLPGPKVDKPWLVDYCFIPTRGGLPISASDPAFLLLFSTPNNKGVKWLLREKDALIASQRMTIAALAKQVNSYCKAMGH